MTEGNRPQRKSRMGRGKWNKKNGYNQDYKVDAEIEGAGVKTGKRRLTEIYYRN